MRKLTYLVACTVDHFIARPDGSADCFLMDGPHITDLARDYPETMPAPVRAQLGIDSPNRLFDAILMGRGTYEVGSLQGLTNPYPQLQQLLFSTTMQKSPDPAVELVQGDPLARVRRLKQDPGKDIWLCGGGQLASALYPEIDELILKIHPVLIGRGIPLFARPITEATLEPLERKLYDNGVQRHHHRLHHRRA